MGTESTSDAKGMISKTVESTGESKPCFGLVEITSKQKVIKKIDVPFQLNQFKKFILFGTETYYKSAPRRSINRWFITETNFRLYVEESKIKSIKNLSDVLGVLDNDAVSIINTVLTTTEAHLTLFSFFIRIRSKEKTSFHGCPIF